jgi:hypothetical protein
MNTFSLIIDNNTVERKWLLVTIQAIQVAGCGDVIIDTTKFGDVLHVPGVGPNLLSIYHITHTNKRWNFGWIDGL